MQRARHLPGDSHCGRCRVGQTGTSSHFPADIAGKWRRSLVCRIVYFSRIYGQQLFLGFNILGARLITTPGGADGDVLDFLLALVDSYERAEGCSEFPDFERIKM